ncbi:PadR family transcriptional regulator [Saliphagus infecundisoli]|uniref:PadR family transcriptional regulator n=1 Tax=Saliphagus infecundisoli TaxID=1849069 RepID=A0ABD5QL19_9EURY|nr:PadR family transcriptional regulator [Saliphagus infecundisoli]
MADLTGFQRDLLFVLSGLGTPSGSELMSKVEQSQDRPVLHGRLYSNLDDLVEAGYIEKGELDGRTNYYALTDEGYEKLRARHEWEQEHLEAPSTADAD